MARVTHVKRAQQRYETKPVLDDQGKPVKIALTKADGTPKMTSSKGGKRTPRPVFITKTEPDKTRPKPNYKCGKCGTEIQPGMPYKWIKPKSGPYGGHMMVRCASCPTWQVWDYSSSLSAQTARIAHYAMEAISQAGSAEEVTSALEEAAQEIRDLAEQKRESAQNIEDGFGHETYQSEELNSTADELDAWAYDVEGTDITDLGDIECEGGCEDGQVDCDACGGTGAVEDETDAQGGSLDCEDCDSTGKIDCDVCEGTGEDLDAARETWIEEASIVDECPV